ncbi:outer membrane protein assembly factor BamB [mine drainage metagenome]|uniref:Outer membrane protein assembly factor BamB n=1 Tax=mine drainage metagenome TaxID=410659 RepID=A0A1J5Q9S1_9ZZZZ
MNARHRSRHAAAALALIAGIALAGCSSAPKRPDPTPLGAVPPILQVAQAWHAELGAALPQTFSPVLAAGGVVVAAADGSVARFDATSGRELWRSRVPGGISAGVGSDGRFSAVVNARNQLASLGPQGQLLWLYQLPTSVITPPLMVEGVDVPVIESILDNNVWTLSVMLSWLPVAPELTNVIGVPLTVMVSPAAKLVESESEPAAPDKSVAPVIGAAALLFCTVPVAVPAGSKKSCPASTAEAATSVVLASALIDAFNAAVRLLAVAVGVVPIAKLPVGGGVALDAVN